MIAIVGTIERWRREGKRVALATLVDVENSAPQDPGAALAVNDGGEIAGSISGGCVESELFEEAQRALATGTSRLVTYGISDETALEHGLTCGGTLHVFVEPLAFARMAVFERVAAAIHAGTPVAVATRLDGERVGANLVVDERETSGDLGTPALDNAVEIEARALLHLAQTSLVSYRDGGEAGDDGARVFIQTFAPKPDMYVFGAIDFSRAMASVGRFIGYRVTVVDARPVFATEARIPDADEIVVAWPDEFLKSAKVERRTVIIVLTHDVKFDIPLLRVALETSAEYIGVMGSRRTHANRVALLLEAGVDGADVARIHAPIGLDLGARTPEETSISIAAEIIAERAGRAGGQLRLGTLPVHGAPRAAVSANACARSS